MSWTYTVHAFRGVAVERLTVNESMLSCEHPYDYNKFCSKCGKEFRQDIVTVDKSHEYFIWDEFNGVNTFKNNWTVMDNEFQELIFIGEHLSEIEGKGSDNWEHIDLGCDDFPYSSLEKDVEGIFKIKAAGIFLINEAT